MTIGSSLSFCPGYRKGDWRGRRRRVTGRVVYINRAHRYFLVVAPYGDGKELRECFKF